MFVFGLFPRRFALFLAATLGSLAFTVIRREREKALTHLRQVYAKQKSEEEIRKLARQVFIHSSKAAVDWLLHPRISKSKWAEMIGSEEAINKAKELLSLGKGLIVVTGHIGNWELLASTIILFISKGAAVGRRIYYEPYNRLIAKLRLSKGVHTVYRDESPRRILKILKQNETVGILMDQDVDSIDGVFVPFLGKLAYTPNAPAKLSMTTGAPILPCFLIRDGLKYRFEVDEPIIPNQEASIKEDEVKRITLACNQAIEKKILKYPEQWVWMHRRWKTRPRVNEYAT